MHIGFGGSHRARNVPSSIRMEKGGEKGGTKRGRWVNEEKMGSSRAGRTGVALD